MMQHISNQEETITAHGMVKKQEKSKKYLKSKTMEKHGQREW